MERSLVCLKCSTHANHVHEYPCGKAFCHNCIVNYTYAKIKVFKHKLNNELESLKDQASYLGCVEDCGECRVSMSIKTLQSFLEHSDLNAEDRNEFIKLSTIGCSYFSGIKVSFFKCLNCEDFWYYREILPFICTNCIRAMLLERVSFEAKIIKYEWANSIEDVGSSWWMDKQFHLVKFDPDNETYYNYPMIDNQGNRYYKVLKINRISQGERFIIVRALELNTSDDNFLMIDNNVQDVKLICLAKAY